MIQSAVLMTDRIVRREVPMIQSAVLMIDSVF